MTFKKSRHVPFVAQFQRADVAAWIARMLQKRGINAHVVSDTNVLVCHTKHEVLIDLWQSLPTLPAYVSLLGQAYGATYVALAGGTVWRWSGITWLFEALPATWSSHPAYHIVYGEHMPQANEALLSLESVELALSVEVRALIRQQAARNAGTAHTTPFAQVTTYLDSEALALLIRDLEDYAGHQVGEQCIAHIIKLCWAEGNRRVGELHFSAIVAEYES